MSFLQTLQTQSKEDATKALFDILNSKAMDAMTSMQEEFVVESDDKEHVPGNYSAKNPKIDLHHKHTKTYIASTNWSPTVKHAVKSYELRHPDMKNHVCGYINKDKNESTVSEEFVVEVSKTTLQNHVSSEKAGGPLPAMNAERSTRLKGLIKAHDKITKKVNDEKLTKKDTVDKLHAKD